MTKTPEEPSEASKEPGDSQPPEWWTKTQPDISESYAGNPEQKKIASRFRSPDSSPGKDGMHRANPAIKMTYDEAIDWLW